MAAMASGASSVAVLEKSQPQDGAHRSDEPHLGVQSLCTLRWS